MCRPCSRVIVALLHRLCVAGLLLAPLSFHSSLPLSLKWQGNTTGSNATVVVHVGVIYHFTKSFKYCCMVVCGTTPWLSCVGSDDETAHVTVEMYYVEMFSIFFNFCEMNIFDLNIPPEIPKILSS